ncbi:MAG: tyrosine-type recombinase/integrase [Terrimicrobiaceae bacterium]
MVKPTKKRSLIADPPKGISFYHQKSGADSSGKRKEGYYVRVGKKFSGKKATYKFVSDRDEAREYIDSLRPHAEVIKSAQITPQNVSDVVHCLELLKKKNSRLSLMEAVTLAMKYDTTGLQKTIGEVADEMVKSAVGREARKRSIVQLQSTLDKICDTFKDRHILSVTGDEISEWLSAPKVAIRDRRRVLKGPRKQVTPRNFTVPRVPKVVIPPPPPPPKVWGARTKNNYLKQFSQLYAFAVRKGYCVDNPCKGLDAIKITRQQPGILTPAQVRTLLEAARAQTEPDILRFIALAAFGWIRRSEICSLKNADFRRDGTIYIHPDIAKTREWRYIPVNDTLKAWLAVAPKSDEPVPSSNVDVMGHWLSDLAASVGIKIPHNALRHSAISYALAFAPTRNGKPMLNTAGELAKYAGNSDTIIYSNYRQLVTEEEGQDYWQILP